MFHEIETTIYPRLIYCRIKIDLLQSLHVSFTVLTPLASISASYSLRRVIYTVIIVIVFSSTVPKMLTSHNFSENRSFVVYSASMVTKKCRTLLSEITS